LFRINGAGPKNWWFIKYEPMLTRYFLILLLGTLPVSHAWAQVTGWFKPLNFGLLTPTPDNWRYDDIFFISQDTGILVSSYGMIFKTYDGAAHWELKKAIAAGIYFRSVEFSGDGQVGIAGTVSGLVYRSADRGESWNDISASIADTGVHPKRICGLAHSGNTFYGVGWWGGTIARFYKSVDAGITWTTNYIDTSLATGLVDITFLSSENGFVTGCRTYNNGSSLESVVLRTTDGGSTWTKVFSDTTLGGRIWKIQFVDSSFGVGSVEPMYRDTVAMIKTTDGGNTWELITVGHVNAWTQGWGTQGVGFLNRQQGWLGGYYNGMFETNDGGLTWDTLSISAECDRFFLFDKTMYLSANTVYKYGSAHEDSLRANGVTKPGAITFVHKLFPIAPNPSKGNVQIEFDINAHQTNTVLAVVNLDGRKIYPIMDGYLKPGHYTYKWERANAPNGNYMVWLGTDEIPMVERFVLER
jgi:photosystem II stability/assembly factor-like uncharacterized protein